VESLLADLDPARCWCLIGHIASALLPHRIPSCGCCGSTTTWVKARSRQETAYAAQTASSSPLKEVPLTYVQAIRHRIRLACTHLCKDMQEYGEVACTHCTPGRTQAWKNSPRFGRNSSTVERTILYAPFGDFQVLHSRACGLASAVWLVALPSALQHQVRHSPSTTLVYCSGNLVSSPSCAPSVGANPSEAEVFLYLYQACIVACGSGMLCVCRRLHRMRTDYLIYTSGYTNLLPLSSRLAVLYSSLLLDFLVCATRPPVFPVLTVEHFLLDHILAIMQVSDLRLHLLQEAVARLHLAIYSPVTLQSRHRSASTDTQSGDSGPCPAQNTLEMEYVSTTI